MAEKHDWDSLSNCTKCGKGFVGSEADRDAENCPGPAPSRVPRSVIAAARVQRALHERRGDPVPGHIEGLAALHMTEAAVPPGALEQVSKWIDGHTHPDMATLRAALVAEEARLTEAEREIEYWQKLAKDAIALLEERDPGKNYMYRNGLMPSPREQRRTRELLEARERDRD